MEDNQGACIDLIDHEPIYINYQDYPYYKHPIYNNYAANGLGVIYKLNTKEYKFPNEIYGHFKGCPQSKHIKYRYKDIKLDFYSRCEEYYPAYQFIWECFNGIFKTTGYRIISIDGKTKIKSLKCVKNDDKNYCKC